MLGCWSGFVQGHAWYTNDVDSPATLALYLVYIAQPSDVSVILVALLASRSWFIERRTPSVGPWRECEIQSLSSTVAGIEVSSWVFVCVGLFSDCV